MRAEANAQAAWIAERLGDGWQPVLPYVLAYDREIVASAHRLGVRVTGTKGLVHNDSPWYYTTTSGWSLLSETSGVQMIENHGQHSSPHKALAKAKQDWQAVIELAYAIKASL